MLAIKISAQNFCAGLILLMASFTNHLVCGQAQEQNVPAQEFKIDIQKLNNSLGTGYSTLDLGKPIPLRPSTYYLITVGGWETERRPGQVQGEVFRRSMRFWPDPGRMEHIFINGKFKQLILFDSRAETYKSLLEDGDFVDQIQLLNPALTKNKDQLLLCAKRRANDQGYQQMRLISILKNKSFLLFKEDQIVLDWAVNAGTRELIVLTEPINSGKQMGTASNQVKVTKIELETLLIQ